MVYRLAGYCLILILISASSWAAEPISFVDIKIYIPTSLKIDEQALQTEILNARRIFAQAGVTLHFLPPQKVNIAGPDLSLIGNIPQSAADPQEKRFYKRMEQEKHRLSDRALQVFSNVVKEDENADRTIHVILLKELKSVYYEGQQRMIVPTGAQSFPAYLMGDRIPRKLRGVISLQHFEGRNLAHELGHKLMNVSHEWRHVGPQMEIRAEGGLMLYGQGEEIPEGERGRWHLERLRLSPFLYQYEKGIRIWNPDYTNGGVYDDALYGSFVADDSI